MQTADVVLYDRLVSPAILDLVSKECKMLYVGKQAGFHTRTQDEIEAMLLGRGSHSSTFWLNVSAFCGIGGACRGCLGSA
jgi:uroporphyrin-III C-methyltransferase